MTATCTERTLGSTAREDVMAFSPLTPIAQVSAGGAMRRAAHLMLSSQAAYPR